MTVRLDGYGVILRRGVKWRSGMQMIEELPWLMT